MLLVGAGLFTRTLTNLRTSELNFDLDNVLLATIATRDTDSIDALKAFWGEVRARLEQVPGVRAVSMSWSVLTAGGTYVRPVSIPGTDVHASEINVQVMGEAFFRTMQIPILAGRDISDQEVEAARPVAIVDRRFVETYFPGLDPIGRTIEVEGEGVLEVVGVSANARHDVVKGDVRPVVHYTYTWDSHPLETLVFELRTERDPLSYAATLRRVGHDLNPRAQVVSTRTQASTIDRSISQEIAFARLCSAFAVFALLIASVGLYGTMSHSLGRRTNEIGIRMALGARRGVVMRLVLGEALTLGLVGIAIGVPVSLVSSRLIESFLWGIEADDALTIAVAAATLLAAVLVAGYAPACRASRIDPTVALRQD